MHFTCLTLTINNPMRKFDYYLFDSNGILIRQAMSLGSVGNLDNHESDYRNRYLNQTYLECLACYYRLDLKIDNEKKRL